MIMTTSRTVSRSVALGSVLCLLACGGQAATPEPSSERAAHNPTEPVVDPTPVEPTLDPSPEPVLRFWAEPNEEGATLHVQNRGTETVRLRSAVGLELKEGESWSDVPVELALRMDCESDVAECITLAPGAELVPPPWNGMRGHAQCDCERCVDLPGEVRFVIQSCAPEGHRPHEVRSEPLTR